MAIKYLKKNQAYKEWSGVKQCGSVGFHIPKDKKILKIIDLRSVAATKGAL